MRIFTFSRWGRLQKWFCRGWTSFLGLYLFVTILAMISGGYANVPHLMYVIILVAASLFSINVFLFPSNAAMFWLRMILLISAAIVLGILFDFWRNEPFWAFLPEQNDFNEVCCMEGYINENC